MLIKLNWRSSEAALATTAVKKRNEPDEKTNNWRLKIEATNNLNILLIYHYIYCVL